MEAVADVEWCIADGYLLQGFAYHDGTIQEFRYGEVLEDGARRRDLLLNIANVEGETVRLQFSRVEVLRLTELWEASIINSIHAARLSDPIVAQSPFESFRQQLEWTEADIRKSASRLGGHLAVVLFGSYGCAFSLICGDLHVSKTTYPGIE